MAQINENRMDGLRSEVENITNTLESQNTGETARERLLNSARNIITVINFTPTIQGPRMLQKQFDLVDALQHLAYYDPDTGGVKDIAEWCVQRWLNLLQQYPESWQALKDREEEITASDLRSRRAVSAGKKAKRDNPLHSADYVEARGTLLPSTEYFSRAVTAAEKKNELTGELLVLAAEAFMSLGNVSYADTNIQYFSQAVKYLRMASSIKGYRLPSHLSKYLQEYGRLVPL
ncbi:hypothetical protein M432DRAFT_676219 [Thermoascus aurantiacus ATCC 26904]